MLLLSFAWLYQRLIKWVLLNLLKLNSNFSISTLFGGRLVVLTYQDGTVTAGFPQLTPKIPYPPPSDDQFYVGTFNGSFAVGGSTVLPPPNDVTVAVYNNFDAAGNWGLNVLTTLSGTPLPAANGLKIVAVAGTSPATILDLTSKIDWANTALLNDTGAINEAGK